MINILSVPFPPPWTIEKSNNACCIVRDATDQALGYFYFEDDPGRRSAAKLLTGGRGVPHGHFAKLLELAPAGGRLRLWQSPAL